MSNKSEYFFINKNGNPISFEHWVNEEVFNNSRIINNLNCVSDIIIKHMYYFENDYSILEDNYTDIKHIYHCENDYSVSDCIPCEKSYNNSH